MKQQRIAVLALLSLIIAASLAFTIKAVFAQQPKVVFDQGHISPLAAKITYRDGKVRSVMIVACESIFSSLTHVVRGKGDGDAITTLWLDSIAKVKETSDKEGTFVLKNGKEVTLEWKEYDPFFILDGDGQQNEKLQFRNFKSVEFLKGARKDKKAGNGE